jgi:hypothetical protein
MRNKRVKENLPHGGKRGGSGLRKRGQPSTLGGGPGPVLAFGHAAIRKRAQPGVQAFGESGILTDASRAPWLAMRSR